MGARGPLPKPTHLRLLEGRGKKPVNEIKPTGNPKCPSFLPTEAKTIWRRIVNSMPPGFYSAAEQDDLAAYCVAASMHHDAVRAIKKSGAVKIAKNGYEQPSAWITIKNQQTKIMQSLGTRLGIGPAARAAIGAKVENPSGTRRAGLIWS